MLRETQELYAYNRWANRRMLASLSTVEEDLLSEDLVSSFPSVIDTLGHIITSEWVWLSRWRGRSPTEAPDHWDLSKLSGIRSRWVEVEHEQEVFVDGLTEADLDREVAYRTMTGEAYSQPLSQLLRHLVNHSTYHRGQVTTLLRQLGGEPAPTDLVRFYRENQTQEAGTGGR